MCFDPEKQQSVVVYLVWISGSVNLSDSEKQVSSLSLFSKISGWVGQRWGAESSSQNNTQLLVKLYQLSNRNIERMSQTNFSSLSLASSFQALYNKETGTDFVIVCKDDTEIPVHCFVLAAR